MQRVQIYLTDIQYEKVKKLSDKIDMSMSEIIRRALDTHIKKENESHDNVVDGLTMSHLARVGKLTEYLEHPDDSSG